MKRVLVLGTGYVVKPLVDYFIDKCKYEVLVASRDNNHSGLIIAGRALGKKYCGMQHRLTMNWVRW
jgi:hypothetical protein